MKLIALILFAAFTLSAQTNDLNGNQPAANLQTSPPLLTAGQRAEQIRTKCLEGRRHICGKILRVLPGGLVVDSGYVDLMRAPLKKSWLIPGTVTASRPANLMEGHEPEAVCVGVVFLTDFPRGRGGGGAKPKPYDYVNLLGYPAGEFTYTSVCAVRKTVRRFYADLSKAVNLNLNE